MRGKGDTKALLHDLQLFVAARRERRAAEEARRQAQGKLAAPVEVNVHSVALEGAHAATCAACSQLDAPVPPATHKEPPAASTSVPAPLSAAGVAAAATVAHAAGADFARVDWGLSPAESAEELSPDSSPPLAAAVPAAAASSLVPSSVALSHALVREVADWASRVDMSACLGKPLLTDLAHAAAEVRVVRRHGALLR